MMHAILSLAVLAAAPQSDDKQLLQDSYRPGDGTINLCGIAATEFDDFVSQMKSGGFVEENSTDQYQVFNNATRPFFRQIVIARPRETAFPMAYCREVKPTPDGRSTLSASMHCQGAKSDCDAVFIDFQNHDRKISASLGQ